MLLLLLVICSCSNTGCTKVEFTWVRMTTDGVVVTAPGKIGTVIVTPDSSSNQADVTLYDGESTQDPQLITIRTGAGVTKSVNFQPYLQTQRGVYLDVGSNVEEVLIQLCWDKE